MKKLFLFFTIAITISNYSQNLSKLDSNNGFKHLKFGTLLSQIKDLKINSDYNKSYEKMKYYDYIGSDLKYIDGVIIEKLPLDFTKMNFWVFKYNLKLFLKNLMIMNLT